MEPPKGTNTANTLIWNIWLQNYERINLCGFKLPSLQYLLQQLQETKLITPAHYNTFFFLLAALGLRCCAQAFFSCGERGLLFVEVHGLLIAVASRCGALALGTWASVVAACELSSCSMQTLKHMGFSSCGAWAQQLQCTGSRVRGLQQLLCLSSVVVAHGLQSAGSVVVAHGLSCSAACGIFPDQGSNPCPLHWQVDSYHCATGEVLRYLLLVAAINLYKIWV